MDDMKVVLMVLLVWAIGFGGGWAAREGDSRAKECEVIGSHLLDNGAVLVVRECDDGTLVREYPWTGE